MQTSMNLTRFAYQGQSNQATVWWNPNVYSHFSQVFELLQTKTQGGVPHLPNRWRDEHLLAGRQQEQ